MQARTHSEVTGFNGCSVEFSPFFQNRVAVGTAQYFGIIGNGRLHVFDIDPVSGNMVEVRSFDTSDGIYDTAWNEMNEHQIVSVSSDGSVKLWDINTMEGFPILNYKEHMQEVSAVNWNLATKDTFVTSSWDKTLKVWDPNSPHSIRTLAEHTYCVYNAAYSPHRPQSILSCSGDHTVKIWDMFQGTSAQTVRAHEAEILACDWNKYNEFVFVTGSVDRTLKVWDIRRLEREVVCLQGHTYGIRRLKCSPHSEDIIGSVAYDMTLCLWNWKLEDALFAKCDHHSEFVLGLDFNLFVDGLISTCSWDRYVCVWNFKEGFPVLPPPMKAAPIPPQ